MSFNREKFNVGRLSRRDLANTIEADIKIVEKTDDARAARLATHLYNINNVQAGEVINAWVDYIESDLS